MCSSLSTVLAVEAKPIQDARGEHQDWQNQQCSPPLANEGNKDEMVKADQERGGYADSRSGEETGVH